MKPGLLHPTAEEHDSVVRWPVPIGTAAGPRGISP